MLPSLSTIWAGVWLLLSAPVGITPGDTWSLSSLTAAAAITVLAVLVTVALRRAATTRGTTQGPAAAPVAATAGHYGVPRLCDPDAAGRPRPRAPTADPAA